VGRRPARSGTAKVKGETSPGRAVAVRASLTEANNTKLDVPDRLSSVFIGSLMRQVERRRQMFGTTTPSLDVRRTRLPPQMRVAPPSANTITREPGI
jgi:hypothetical protein